MEQDGLQVKLIKTQSVATKRALRFKNNHKCMYCGEPLYCKVTCCEHILPQSLIKYVGYDERELEEFKGLYNDYRNIYIIHKNCLMSNRPRVMFSKEDIDELYISRADKAEVKELIDEAQKYIDAYYGVCEKYYEKQKGKCYMCKRAIADKTLGVLRRKDAEVSRFEEENVMMVCSECNKSLKRVRYSIKQGNEQDNEIESVSAEEAEDI